MSPTRKIKGRAPSIGEMTSTAFNWPGSLGIGLSGIRERTKELGGTVRLTNTNPGTLVEVVIPAEYSLPLKERATA